MQSKFVEVSGLCKSYGKTQVLKDVSFTLDPGSFVSLVGPNGTGKSTLLKVLMRIEMPDLGEAKVLGRSIHQDDAQFNTHLGYVSEAVDYTFPFSMREFASFYRKIQASWSEEKFKELTDLFKIPLERSFREVSRGQKMQFAFAIVYSSQPKVLFLDEITAVLDASVRLDAMKYLKSFTQQGGVLLLTTNILTEVQSFADRLMIIHNGKIGYDDKVANFSDKYAKIRVLYGADNPILRDLDCKEVAINSDQSISYLIPKHKVEGVKVDFDNRGITPEDLFIYHTRKVG